jgi:hypothetical protein
MWQLCGAERERPNDRPECDIPWQSVRKYVTARRGVRNVGTQGAGSGNDAARALIYLMALHMI